MGNGWAMYGQIQHFWTSMEASCERLEEMKSEKTSQKWIKHWCCRYGISLITGMHVRVWFKGWSYCVTLLDGVWVWVCESMCVWVSVCVCVCVWLWVCVWVCVSPVCVDGVGNPRWPLSRKVRTQAPTRTSIFKRNRETGKTFAGIFSPIFLARLCIVSLCKFGLIEFSSTR